MQHNKPITDKTLWLKILFGMGLGIALGMVLSPTGMAIVSNENALMLGEWIALPGVIFLGLLTMIVIPLGYQFYHIGCRG